MECTQENGKSKSTTDELIQKQDIIKIMNETKQDILTKNRVNQSSYYNGIVDASLDLLDYLVIKIKLM
jgi:hypothetical protein